MYKDMKRTFWWKTIKRDIFNLCQPVQYLSTSQKRSTKGGWITSTFRSPRMEMGADIYGF